jgi:hypothetical protein
VRGDNTTVWGFYSSISRIVLGGCWILNISRRVTFSWNFGLARGQPLIDTIHLTKREADRTKFEWMIQNIMNELLKKRSIRTRREVPPTSIV